RNDDRSRGLADTSSRHLGRGVGVQAGQLAPANVKLIQREEPARLVPAVVYLGDYRRAAQRESPLVLNAQRFRRREEAARVEVLVVMDSEPGAMQLVGARLHRETRDPGKRVGVFGR